jgi:HK97 family phage portal protein
MGLLNFFRRDSNNEFIPINHQRVLDLIKNKGVDKSDWQYAYEQNIDAFSVIKRIVDASKEAKWCVQKKNADGIWELDNSTDIQGLLENPNEFKSYTWNDIQEMVLIYLLCNGNAYLFGERLNGKIAELDVLPPNYMDIVCNGNFFLPKVDYTLQIDTTNKKINNDDLAHIKFFNPYYSSVEDSIKGLSLFQVAAHAIKVGNNRWQADSALLENRGVVGLISNKSEFPMTDVDTKRVQDSFDRDFNGTEKYGKIKVTNQNLEYTSMGMSSVDLQLLEKGVITLRSMCNVFGLDSSLFNDPANKTFNNRLEAEKALYTNAVIPLSRVLASKYNQLITKSYFPDGNYRLYQDFEKISALQKDKKTEAEKDKIVMESINIVMGMPISLEAKKRILIEEFEISQDLATEITKPTNNEN